MVIATTHSVTTAVFLTYKEVRLRQQDFKLIERNAVGNDPRIGRHMGDLGVALERRDDHVIGRDQKKDREQH
jgi:hypothetical protein